MTEVTFCVSSREKKWGGACHLRASESADTRDESMKINRRPHQPRFFDQLSLARCDRHRRRFNACGLHSGASVSTCCAGVHL